MKAIRNKAALIFIICSLFVTKGYSGDSISLNKSNRYIIGVSVGSALPFLNFSKPNSGPPTSNYDSSYYGYAKIGFHFDVNAKIFFTPHFGLIGIISGNLNSFNTAAYNNNISYNEPGTTNVNANNYYTGEYMLGVYLHYPFKGNHPNLSWDISFMGGYISTNFPTITTIYLATPAQSGGESTLTANSAHSFVGEFSFGLHDEITQHLIVSLDCSFSFTHLDFSSGLYTEAMQGSPPLTTTPGNPMNMWVGLFKPTLGVGYIF